MYSETTLGIEITVEPEFMADQSEPSEGRWFWAYTIRIQNNGSRTVRLMHRHWRITDANGRLEEVKGPGVVGEQPILSPGQSFSYTSGCPLPTASGIMVGSYRFVDDKGEAFDVAIPAFSLDSPQTRRSLN
jgi:ApaG protein